MDRSIIDAALECKEQLSSVGLAELAGYTKEELHWAKMFWEPSFNSGWLYVSRDMLVQWFGYSENDKALMTKFIKKLEDQFEVNVDYKIIDGNDDLVKFYEQSFALLFERAKKDARGGANRKHYAVTGETFKSLFMMASTQKGKVVRKYYLKTEGLAVLMNTYLLEFQKKELTIQLDKYKLSSSTLQNYVNNVKQRLKKEIIYIATSKNYAAQNVFKVGGCGSRKALASRLAQYNTGRHSDDLYYFCYIGETTEYKQIEARMKHLLGEFRDKKEAEMYVMHYNSLRAFVELVKNNLDTEIQELNTFITQFATDMIDLPPVVPEEIVLNEVRLQVIRNGEEVESKTMDLRNFDDAKQRAIVKQLLGNFMTGLPPNVKEVKRSAFELFVEQMGYKFGKLLLWNVTKKVIGETPLKIKY